MLFMLTINAIQERVALMTVELIVELTVELILI